MDPCDQPIKSLFACQVGHPEMVTRFGNAHPSAMHAGLTIHTFYVPSSPSAPRGQQTRVLPWQLPSCLPEPFKRTPFWGSQCREPLLFIFLPSKNRTFNLFLCIYIYHKMTRLNITPLYSNKSSLLITFASNNSNVLLYFTHTTP